MIKVALVGCGYWGKNYVTTIEKLKKIELIWVCDPKPSLKKRDFPSSCKLTASYSDILKDPQVQGIIIATPPETHYELTKKALLSGKHVLIEKPMVNNSSQAQSLIKIAKSKSLVLMVGHVYLYHPVIVELKKRIKKGELGRIKYLYSRRSSWGPFRENIGALWNLAPHDISISNYLIGKKPILALTNGIDLKTTKTENVVDITLDYGKGVKAFSHLSLLEPRKTRELVVVGDKKIAIFDDLAENQLLIFKISNNVKPEKGQVVKISKISPLEAQCQHFFTCIKNEKTPLTDGKNGLDTVLILESLSQSQKSTILHK